MNPKNGANNHHQLSREALERSQLFLDSLIEYLPIMVFVKEAHELRFVHFNRAGEALLGLKREQLIGKNDYDFFPKDQADFFTSKDRAVLENGALTDIAEEPISTRTGLRYLHTRKIPLMGEDGKAAFLLGISEDITERKTAELELRESQERLRLSHAELEKHVQERTAQLNEAVRSRDEFISIASHELKTPLTPLKLQIQNLQRQLAKTPAVPLQPDQVAKVLNTANRQISRLTHLIDDLLDVSRITAGKFNLRREELDLRELLRETLEAQADALKQARNTVTLEAPEPVHGYFDRIRIEQVVSNLLGNATKYAPESPISLTLANQGDCARITVADRGPGLPPNQVERLFQRFERGSGVIGGLGLGLYICRQIVEAHGGRIEAECPSEGGARFQVFLPLRPPA